MSILSKKIVVIILVILLMELIFFIVKGKLNPASSSTTTEQNSSPHIVATKPSSLENSVISTTDIVEITFNKPLKNAEEFKYRIEPKVDTKIELSADRKTAKITHQKPYELGLTYTLFIDPDTKFDGVSRWGEDKIFHFQTVSFRGI